VKRGIFFFYILVDIAGLAHAVMAGNLCVGIIELHINAAQAAFANMDNDGFRLKSRTAVRAGSFIAAQPINVSWLSS